VFKPAHLSIYYPLDAPMNPSIIIPHLVNLYDDCMMVYCILEAQDWFGKRACERLEQVFLLEVARGSTSPKAYINHSTRAHWSVL